MIFAFRQNPSLQARQGAQDRVAFPHLALTLVYPGSSGYVLVEVASRARWRSQLRTLIGAAVLRCRL